MEAHIKECPLQEVECSFECGKMLQRRYLTSHVEECPCRRVDCQHCQITGEHRFIEKEHKEQCPKLPLPCPNKCEVGSVPREDMEVHRKECPLEMIQCEYHEVGCEERMKRNDLEEHYSKKVHKHLAMTTRQLNDTKGALTLTQQQLKDTQDKITKLETSQWTFQLMMSTSNYNVMPLTIKIQEFFNRKKRNTEWFSNSFCTGEKGYKMCLRVDAAGHGNGKGTHLSVFLYLMKGPHDNKLTWPLRGKFELKLLNQISDCEHHSHTLLYGDHVPVEYTDKVIDGDRANGGWGYAHFISHEDLHKATPMCQYLKDDCIFLKVGKL